MEKAKEAKQLKNSTSPGLRLSASEIKSVESVVRLRQARRLISLVERILQPVGTKQMVGGGAFIATLSGRIESQLSLLCGLLERSELEILENFKRKQWTKRINFSPKTKKKSLNN